METPGQCLTAPTTQTTLKKKNLYTVPKEFFFENVCCVTVRESQCPSTFNIQSPNRHFLFLECVPAPGTPAVHIPFPGNGQGKKLACRQEKKNLKSHFVP